MNAESEKTTAEKPKKGGKKIRFIGGGALALVLLAAGLYLGGFVGSGKKQKAQATPVAAAGSEGQPVFVETPEMITNLDAGPHRVSFVKVQCKVELSQSADIAKMNASMPRFVDLVQTYLRETRPEELRSDTGTYRLREALLSRAAVVAPTVDVKDVFFEELIVQ